MRSFQQRVLERHGFSGDTPSCAEADLCPAVSLTDLFGEGGGPQSEEQVRALIEAIPPYFSQAAITRDPVTGGIGDTANIAFGIRVQPLDQQQELIEDIRAQIDPPGAPGPPEGTEVELAGLPVIAAEANDDLSREPLVAAAGRARGGGAGARAGLPLGPPCPGAAAAGCAGDRLVGAGGGARWTSPSTRCRPPLAPW